MITMKLKYDGDPGAFRYACRETDIEIVDDPGDGFFTVVVTNGVAYNDLGNFLFWSHADAAAEYERCYGDSNPHPIVRRNTQ
jgi:hypothetical protein